MSTAIFSCNSISHFAELFHAVIVIPLNNGGRTLCKMHNRYGEIINSIFYTSQLPSNEKYPLKNGKNTKVIIT